MTSLGVSIELGEAVVWVGLFLACFRDGREKQRRASELPPTAGSYRALHRHASRRSLPPYLPPSHVPSSRLLEPLGMLGDAAGYAYLERATDVEGEGEGWPGGEGWPHSSFPRPGSRASFYDDELDIEAPGGRSLSAPLQRELLEARRDAFEQDQRSALVRDQQREVIALQKQLALLGCTPPAASAASAVAANSPASAPEGYNTSPPGAGEGGGEGASSHHRPSASTPFLV